MFKKKGRQPLKSLPTFFWRLAFLFSHIILQCAYQSSLLLYRKAQGVWRSVSFNMNFFRLVLGGTGVPGSHRSSVFVTHPSLRLFLSRNNTLSYYKSEAAWCRFVRLRGRKDFCFAWGSTRAIPAICQALPLWTLSSSFMLVELAEKKLQWINESAKWLSCEKPAGCSINFPGMCELWWNSGIH